MTPESWAAVAAAAIPSIVAAAVLWIKLHYALEAMKVEAAKGRAAADDIQASAEQIKLHVARIRAAEGPGQ